MTFDHKLFHAFQLTAARRRLDQFTLAIGDIVCFNSQPPEGGWQAALVRACIHRRFNSQPPEGGWLAIKRH